MTFQPVSTELQDKTRNAVYGAAEINKSGIYLSQQLKRVYDSKVPSEEWGVIFEMEEDKADSFLHTPFGIARTKLYVMVDEEGIYGRYVIEKQFLKRNDEIAWMPVWAIRLSEHGHAFAGDTKDNPINLKSHFGERVQIQIGELALSILYVIGNTSI